MIFGVMQDKAPQEMAGILFPAARKVILTKANSPRAADPQALARELAPLHNGLICAASLPEALAEASRDVMPNELIVICGSLYLAGEALAFANQ